MQNQSPRRPIFLFFGFIGISVIGWLINTVRPTNISVIILFLFLIFFTTLPLFYFLLNNVRRSVLISTGIAIFLILRYVQLREPYYVLLLVLLLLSFEFFYIRK